MKKPTNNELMIFILLFTFLIDTHLYGMLPFNYNNIYFDKQHHPDISGQMRVIEQDLRTLEQKREMAIIDKLEFTPSYKMYHQQQISIIVQQKQILSQIPKPNFNHALQNSYLYDTTCKFLRRCNINPGTLDLLQLSTPAILGNCGYEKVTPLIIPYTEPILQFHSPFISLREQQTSSAFFANESEIFVMQHEVTHLLECHAEKSAIYQYLSTKKNITIKEELFEYEKCLERNADLLMLLKDKWLATSIINWFSKSPPYERNLPLYMTDQEIRSWLNRIQQAMAANEPKLCKLKMNNLINSLNTQPIKGRIEKKTKKKKNASISN